jgi:hypothetical protein
MRGREVLGEEDVRRMSRRREEEERSRSGYLCHEEKRRGVARSISSVLNTSFPDIVTTILGTRSQQRTKEDEQCTPPLRSMFL